MSCCFPAWPWSHRGRWEDPARTDPRTWVEVPQSQSPGRWHCSAFLGVNCAVISGCHNTISTADPPHQAPCSHHPLPIASQSPSSLFFHPVPLCHPMPCCHLLSPAPSLPRQPLTPLPAPPCFHISGLPTLPPHHLFFHAWTFTPITAGNPQAQPGSWSPIFP